MGKWACLYRCWQCFLGKVCILIYRFSPKAFITAAASQWEVIVKIKRKTVQTRKILPSANCFASSSHSLKLFALIERAFFSKKSIKYRYKFTGTNFDCAIDRGIWRLYQWKKHDFIMYFKLKNQHINIYQAQNSNAAGKYFLETSKRWWMKAINFVIEFSKWMKHFSKWKDCF